MIIKLNKYILTLILVLASYNYSYAEDFTILKNPIKAPEGMFYDSYDNIKTIDQYSKNNKLLIINFWAIWCKPCLVEMPSLNALQLIFKAKKLKILPLMHDKSNVSKVRSFYRRYKLKSIEYFIDYNKFTATNYKVTGIPTSIIIKDGYIVATVDGSINWIDPKNIEYINTLLK